MPGPAPYEDALARLMQDWPGALLADLAALPRDLRRTVGTAMLGRVVGELAHLQRDPAVIKRIRRLARTAYRNPVRKDW